MSDLSIVMIVFISFSAGAVISLMFAIGNIKDCAEAHLSDPQPKWWKDALVMARARKEIGDAK